MKLFGKAKQAIVPTAASPTTSPVSESTEKAQNAVPPPIITAPQDQGDTMSNSDVTHAQHVNLKLKPQPATTPSPAAPNRLLSPLAGKPSTDPVTAPNAALATEPTQNQVFTFEPPPKTVDSPPAPDTVPNYVKTAAKVLCVASLAAVVICPAFFPVFAATTAGLIVTYGALPSLALLAYKLPKIHQFFSNRAARQHT